LIGLQGMGTGVAGEGLLPFIGEDFGEFEWAGLQAVRNAKHVDHERVDRENMIEEAKERPQVEISADLNKLKVDLERLKALISKENEEPILQKSQKNELHKSQASKENEEPVLQQFNPIAAMYGGLGQFNPMTAALFGGDMPEWGEEFEGWGAELPLPGHIMVSFDEDHSTATKVRFNYQLLAGYIGVTLHWVITDQLHVNLPDIALGNYAACEACSGSIEMKDHAVHQLEVDVKLGKGHYGFWAVGEGRSDRFTKQLILALPYGLYWNIGPADVEFSFLYANMGCGVFDTGIAHGEAFAANAEDCAYITAANSWCGPTFLFNTVSHVCSCIPFGAMGCEFSPHTAMNVYKITSVTGGKPRGLPGKLLQKQSIHKMEDEQHQSVPTWAIVGGTLLSLLLILSIYFGRRKWLFSSAPYAIDMDETNYSMHGANLLENEVHV